MESCCDKHAVAKEMSNPPVIVAAATAAPSLQTCPRTVDRHHCSGALGLAPSQSGLKAALAAHTGSAAAPALSHLL